MFKLVRPTYVVCCALTCYFVTAASAAVSADEVEGGFDHGEWPFQPPERPTLPTAETSAWVRNPVDQFVLHKLERAGLAPSNEADKLTLLRRVTFDLTGLPPTLAQQRAYLEDTSPDAYDRLVEELISSPRFGERWAQHWLDVVRYAETEGFKADSLRPLAYQYRDYVIRSFNSDRPYDRFVCQQLAGDELEPDNPDAIIATGLNRLYPDENNAANLFQRREEILTDITETSGLALMGLTMGCAQCHDHKFDDILQTDFYRLRAFFAGVVERDDLPAATRGARRAYAEQLDLWKQATETIRNEMDQLLAGARAKSDAYNLEKFRKEIRECVLMPPSERSPLQEQVARIALKQLNWRFDPQKEAEKLDPAERQRYADLEVRLASFDHLKPQPLPQAMAISDVGPEAPPTHLFANGNWQTPADEVEPGFPEFLGDVSCEIPAGINSETTTGRRAALAQWLTRSDHPLTARVIVNRLWQHHFGRAIVKSPNDFGVMGEAPTHPKLLDWLAVELVEHNWSLKHLHRLMVTSATYRQTSAVNLDDPWHPLAMQKDSENELLWHAQRRRLEGEALRDAILCVTGQINHAMYGPSSRPRLPEGVSKRYAWQADSDPARQARRSVYVLVKRNMRFPLFDAFDWPDLHQSCGTRSSTVTAPQALLMLNSQFTREAAQTWAANLAARNDNLTGLIDVAYREAFGRAAETEEIEAAEDFVKCQMENAPDAPESTDFVHGVADLCHSLLNANEFLYVD